MRKIKTGVLLALVFLFSVNRGLEAEITEKNIRWVEFPGFPTAHSAWKSLGYSKEHRKVFIGVTNHRDKVALYEYQVYSDTMRLLGFLDEMANLRDFQWQGKIHSEIIEGPDGCMYFSTDGGEVREEYLMNHPHGYYGGLFFKWDPMREKLTNLGLGLRYDSIKDIALDQVGGLVYGVSYPQVHFLVYDPKRNALRDLGRVGSAHVPRTMFSDWWGNCYYTGWRQRLVKYERDTESLLFSRDSIPSFPGTKAHLIITGLSAYATDRESGTIYLLTAGNMIVAFHPQRLGIGPMEALGPTHDTPELPPFGHTPNLACGANGKLYYFIGGHGQYAIQDTTLLMEFDPENKKKRPVLRFPIDVLAEATGCDVKDEQGNLYFAGRKWVFDPDDKSEAGPSRPFLIVFNPERNVR